MQEVTPVTGSGACGLGHTVALPDEPRRANGRIRCRGRRPGRSPQSRPTRARSSTVSQGCEVCGTGSVASAPALAWADASFSLIFVYAVARSCGVVALVCRKVSVRAASATTRC